MKLRIVSFLLLAWIAWAMLTEAPQRHRASASVSDLAHWTRSPDADTLTLALTRTPLPADRDWLGALRGAGTAVLWTGTVPATAIEAMAVADPAGGLRALVAAPAHAIVRLADSIGVIDSATAERGGVSFALAGHEGLLKADVLGQSAWFEHADSLVPRRVAVLGVAGWEAKFVIQALEERGWLVDARLAVGPNLWVTQGSPLPLDTARVSAVVVLDSLAGAEAAQVAAFVRGGGGAIIGAAAARSLAAMAAGSVGEHVRPPVIAFTAATPRRALGLDPILPKGDAAALEHQDAHVAVAARRVGSGRVVQVGYRDTWRWRLAGIADAAQAHRAWWAALVAAGAYRADAQTRRRAEGDPAPLASLVATIGPASPADPAGAGTPDPRRLLPFAALALFGTLVAEWASRRLRGAA